MAGRLVLPQLRGCLYRTVSCVPRSPKTVHTSGSSRPAATAMQIIAKDLG
jgi:hypothetical protein